MNSIKATLQQVWARLRSSGRRSIVRGDPRSFHRSVKRAPIFFLCSQVAREAARKQRRESRRGTDASQELYAGTSVDKVQGRRVTEGHGTGASWRKGERNPWQSTDESSSRRKWFRESLARVSSVKGGGEREREESETRSWDREDSWLCEKKSSGRHEG